ncbi:MAG: ABC transporter ATP-binding protein [Candidatus Anstonellales archaeon]
MIYIKNVSHYYLLGKIKIQALNNINLTIQSSEIVALVGPSGSGKTTLINLIGALDFPQEGEIEVAGINLTKLTHKKAKEYRQKVVSFIFQFFYLFPTLNVYENVEFPLLFITDVSKDERKKRVLNALEILEIVHLRDRMIDEISGGERQRVAIARALVTQPKIILADEPTANLNSELGNKVMESFRKIKEMFGTTIIYATHDQNMLKFATRIIQLKDGKIIND